MQFIDSPKTDINRNPDEIALFSDILLKPKGPKVK